MKEVRDLKDLLDIVRTFSSHIIGEKQDSMQIDCMNYLGKYTTTITVDNAFSRAYRKKSSKMILPADQVYNVKIYSLKPLITQIEGSIRRAENEIIVDLSTVADFEIVRIEVDYRMKKEYLQGMVHHRSSPEPLSDSMKYHLSAQLTDPSSLVAGFSDVEIDEYPVTAQVFVQENLDAAYPVLSTVRKLKEIEQKMISTTDPHKSTEMAALQREHHRLVNKVKREAPDKLLKEIVTILGPSKFSKYIMVKPDFRLHACEWSGIDRLANFSTISLPKEINVVARTDLSLKKPAAHGELLYKVSQFQDDIDDIVHHK